MATMSNLATTDGGDVMGLGGGGADCAREPPVSLGGLWKNSLFYVAVSSRCSHLEIWTLPSPLYLSVLGVWVLPVVYSVLDFSGTRALLGSIVDTCSTGGFGRISVFSTLR